MRKLIEKWLGVDKLARTAIEQHLKIQDLEIKLLKSEKLYRESNSKLLEAKEIATECLKTMNSICEVGADISMDSGRRYDENFVVICIHGKRDYVQLQKMSHQDVRSVESFLKQFRYSNRIVDSYFPFDCYLR